jgi:hypothetical protein
VGLLWGGNSATGDTYANQITDVLSALTITICLAHLPVFDPSPHQFSPSQGVWDSVVTLFGSNFGGGNARVQFGQYDLPHAPLSVTPTQLTVKVPAANPDQGALSGPVNLIVTTDGGSVTSDDVFTIIPT